MDGCLIGNIQPSRENTAISSSGEELLVSGLGSPVNRPAWFVVAALYAYCTRSHCPPFTRTGVINSESTFYVVRGEKHTRQEDVIT